MVVGIMCPVRGKPCPFDGGNFCGWGAQGINIKLNTFEYLNSIDVCPSEEYDKGNIKFLKNKLGKLKKAR